MALHSKDVFRHLRLECHQELAAIESGYNTVAQLSPNARCLSNVKVNDFKEQAIAATVRKYVLRYQEEMQQSPRPIVVKKCRRLRLFNLCPLLPPRTSTRKTQSNPRAHSACPPPQGR